MSDLFEFDEKFLAKVAELRESGVHPYPSNLRITHTTTELHAKYNGVEDPSADAQEFALGGRVMFRNRMGKVMFLRVQDRGETSVAEVDASGEPVLDEEGNPVMRGGVLQFFIRKNDVGEEAYEALKKLDIGDWVWARGTLMRTKTGELSLRVIEGQLASKILTPFPDRFHGVSDVQVRARQRYVDLFMNASSRETFRRRSKIVRYLRNFFEARDFMEVETPMMQTIPGGAAARPFVTHHNALDMELYLRIAPELYLKRLVVGGFERVFEINRSFRNEGVSVKHNPEFTMLEFYQAWATYEDLMDLTEELLTGMVADVCGGAKVEFEGRELDFTAPFRRADMDQLIHERTGLSLEELRDPAAMEAYWRANQPVEASEGLPSTVGKWWEWYFDAYVEDTLINPTFVTGFPAEISPLARRSDADPFRTERFELIVNGWELANAFSELNDPVDQAGRFEAQVQARADGDDEGMHFDADYIRALTYALPPTAGQGIGIDRLTMLLTGSPSIREVILFPTMRNQDVSAATEELVSDTPE